MSIAPPPNHREVGGVPKIMLRVSTLKGSSKDISGMEVRLGDTAREEETEIGSSSPAFGVPSQSTGYEEGTVVFGARDSSPSPVHSGHHSKADLCGENKGRLV